MAAATTARKTQRIMTLAGPMVKVEFGGSIPSSDGLWLDKRRKRAERADQDQEEVNEVV